jgi:hypothetical protein
LHVAVSKSPPFLPLVRLLANGRPELLDTADAEGNSAVVLAAEMAENQTASWDLTYWLVRTKPESVAAPHRTEGRYAAPLQSPIT